MKRINRIGSIPFAGVVLVAGLGANGCTNEKVVFREKPFFTEPAAAAAGFLGYDDEPQKLTVCGNCHVGQQGEWQLTAHADAWQTLQTSGSAQAFCENCHAVSQNGNPEVGSVGWTATADSRYHDVQCESCHGPGETHVSNPDATQPLPQLAVGVDLTSGCGECHQGTHHPFVEEWSQSKHAAPWGEFFPGGKVSGAAAVAEPECQGCHQGQGALRAWGVRSDYLEKDGTEDLPITCAVCHDPHDATNQGQLRFPVVTASVEEHLCARCHNRRTSPDPNSAHGLAPHSPETALLEGTAGWFPPNASIDQGQIRGTHGSQANAALCATCHVGSFTVTDRQTGNFVFQATGHLFEAIPCVDARGIPQAGDCAISTTARSFAGCTTSGCHGSEQAAFSALSTASTRIQGWADQLLGQLQQVDPNLDQAGGQIDANNPTFTVAEGAFFNYGLATFKGSVTGSTVHNPFLTEALLIASIQAVQDTYGISPSLSVDLDAALREVLSKVRS